MEPLSRYRELASRYVEGDLTDEERAELASALGRDPALADAVAAAFRVDACLATHFGVQAEVPAAKSVLRLLAAAKPPAAPVPQRPLLRQRTIWYAAAAAAVLVALLWGLLRTPYPQPKASGAFEVVGGGALCRGATLRTGEQPARVNLGGYCQVEIAPGSVLRLGGRPRDERIALERGRVLCEVAPGAGAFTVETEVCAIAVKGTRFTVELLEPKGTAAMVRRQVMLRVLAGAVLVTAGGEKFEVRAGEERRVPDAPAAGGPSAAPEYPREEIHDTFVGPDEAVTNLRIANCRWPDCYSNESAIRDIFRLEGVSDAATARLAPNVSLGQAQALSLLKWVCILVSTKGGGYVYETDKAGRDVYVYDPHKIFTAYGHHYCDGIGWVLVQLWRASGQMGLDQCHHGHSFPSLRYRDADGHSRYHDLEPEFRSYYWDQDRGIIGTASMPLLRAHVHRHLVQPQHIHTLRTSLREGERREWLWDNHGYVIQPGKQPKRIVLGPEFAYRPGRTDGVYGAVGQETQVFAPSLEPDRYRAALFAAENLACAREPKNGVRLHPAEKGVTASVTYRLPSPFVAVDGSVEARLIKGRDADMCRLLLSRDDGKTWHEIAALDKAGEAAVKASIGLEARANDRPHVYTAYDFLLKAEFRTQADPQAVGLGDLRATVQRQLNKRALPNLLPGENVFRVTADKLAQGKCLRLELAYSVGGEAKSVHHTIASLPFYFAIDTGDVQEKWPTNFDEAFNIGQIRMKSITVQVADAAANVPPSASLPAEAGEAKFRLAYPHPAPDFLQKLPVKRSERHIMETCGFFPQSKEVKHDKETMNALIARLRTGQGVDPWVAAEDLGAYPDAMDALLEMLPKADIDLLLHLCKAFAQIGDKRAAQPLLKLWAEWHRHMPGSRHIPDVLAVLGDRSAVPALIKPLRQMRFDMRFHVIHALGVLGGPEAEATLRELAAHDPFAANRELAQEMLAKLAKHPAQ